MAITQNNLKGNTDMKANTTIYRLTVTSDTATYRPVISVANNGRWKIESHEAMRIEMDAIGPETYTDWLIDFWVNRNRGMMAF